MGIESLDDHVLALMRKGTRALENLRLLKWYHQAGVEVHWNLLYDMPGEDDRDYGFVRAILPAVTFLPPPDTCQPVRPERFSVLFDELRAACATCAPRAASAYGYVYPLAAQDLDEIAYTFDLPASGRRPAATALLRYALRAAVQAWWTAPRDRHVALRDCPDGAVVDDGRPDATADGLLIDPLTERLCRAAEGIATRDQLMTVAGALGAPAGPLPDAVDDRLRLLVDHRLMVASGDRYLSLVQTSPAGGGDS